MEETEWRKGLPHHWKPYELFRRSPVILSRLIYGDAHKLSKYVSKQGRSQNASVSSSQTKNRKRLTLLGKMALEGTVRVNEREVLDEPFTVELFGNLSIDEGGIMTYDNSELDGLQVLRRSDCKC